ncbi:MAG: hypothetical protein WCK86_19020 [Planctomycetia bacterium]
MSRRCNVVICWWMGLFSSCVADAVHGQNPVIPQAYVLEGKLVDASFVSNDIKREQYLFDFVVARTPDRLLHAIQISDNPKGRRAYVFVNSSMDHAVSIDLGPDTVWVDREDMCNIEGMKVNVLVEQEGAATKSEVPFFALADMGRISNAALGIFFGRPLCGHRIGLFDDIDLQTAHVVLLKNEYGRLELMKDNSRHVLLFTQSGENFMKRFDIDQKLSEFRSSLFPTGIVRSEERCEFSISLDQLRKVPWSAKIKGTMLGPDDAGSFTDLSITVTRFVDDADQVNAFFDSVLARIPEGTEVVTRKKLAYEWRDRGIRVVKDAAAIELAQNLTFTPPSPLWKRSIIPICTAIVLLALAVIFRWKKVR